MCGKKDTTLKSYSLTLVIILALVAFVLALLGSAAPAKRVALVTNLRSVETTDTVKIAVESTQTIALLSKPAPKLKALDKQTIIEKAGRAPKPEPKPAPKAKKQQSPKKAYPGSGVERWRPLVKKYFPAHAVDQALLCISIESGGNPNAVSKSGKYVGLFQMNSNWGSFEQRTNPEFAISRAAGSYKKCGWKHWPPMKKRGY